MDTLTNKPIVFLRILKLKPVKKQKKPDLQGLSLE